MVGLTIMAGWLSGGPILFPDSVGYFHAGISALKHFGELLHPQHMTGGALAVEEQDGISTARSVYYGLFYAGTFLAGGQWALPILQATICGVALALTLRRMPISSARLFLWVVPLAAGLPVFCAAAMPDVFAGLMILAVAMIITFSDTMAWPEYIFWTGTVFAASIFHRGHLAVLVLILAACGILARVGWGRLKALVLVAIMAAVAHLAVDITVKRMTGAWPVQTPFLLARFIGDGTAQPFLVRSCPTKHFALCRFGRLWPITENEFLWGNNVRSVMGKASAVEREKIAAEAPSIELGVIRMFPVRESRVTFRNIWDQFFTVGIGAYEQGPLLSADRPVTALHDTIASYLRRDAARAGWFMRAQSTIMALAYLLSFLACVTILVLRDLGDADRPQPRMALVLIIGLVANAVIFGAVSGVFDRYQGRLAWLPVLGLLMLLSRRAAPVAMVETSTAAA